MNYLGKGTSNKTTLDCYALFLTGFQPWYYREGLLGCYSRGNPQVLPDHHRGEGQVEEGTRTGPASPLTRTTLHINLENNSHFN